MDGDRVLLEIPRGYEGRISEVVGSVRRQLPGARVDWTAVREAYRFGRGSPFPVGSLRAEGAQAEKANVRISPDRLTAYLLLYPPRGSGRRLSLEDLEALALAYGLHPGLLDRGTLRRCAGARNYGDPEPIARGHYPIHGHDAWAEWCSALPSDAEGFLRSLGGLEDYPAEVLAVVSEGQTVGVLHPPGRGTAGTDVTGRALPARDGANRLRIGPGLQLGEGGTQVIADRGGHLRLAGPDTDRAEVVPLFQARDAAELRALCGDFVPGSAIVEGDLETASPLCVAGDLEVRGALIRSSVDVLGSLFVRDGIVQRGPAPVRAAEILCTGFLDHAWVQGGTVVVRHSSLKSDVLALERAVAAPAATVQGGSTAAGQSVTTGALGSPGGIRTEVIAGSGAAVETFRSLFREWGAGLRDRTARASGGPAAAWLDPGIWEARLREVAEAGPSQWGITANRVHPGVTVRIGSASRRLDALVGPVEFAYDRVGERGRIALHRA
jgi:uncharacterized protein (DUF342 family)